MHIGGILKNYISFIIFLIITAAYSNLNIKKHEVTGNFFDSKILSVNEIPTVALFNIKTTKGIIQIFTPKLLKINITTIRPNIRDSVFFCVAAAFTSKTNEIEGLFIENGIMKIDKINKSRSGFVEIESGDILFHKFNDSLVETVSKKAVENKGSLFQQQLLIINKSIVPDTLFKNKLNTRRALVELNGVMKVIQSVENLTIYDFQLAMLEIGVSNAIYLDMGSWSEGWYLDSKGKQQMLGNDFTNTKRQTSWLVYKK